MIYLDNNATTRVAPEVLEAMHPYLSEFFGNPSSAHALGREMKRAVEQSREQVASLIRWPLLLGALILGLAFIYRFGPCRENAQWHWVTVGSATTSVLWIIVSVIFSYYAANFGSFNKTYGSLGAVVGFMMWMWISSLVILGGAEIDAVLERADRGTAK